MPNASGCEAKTASSQSVRAKLVSAFHAMRPVFAGREPVVAGGFGLVHGLAFAGAILPFGFSARDLVLSILAFNVGIELMQLAVVVLIVPWLILLSRTRFYDSFRITAAALAAAAAANWIVQRMLHA